MIDVSTCGCCGHSCAWAEESGSDSSEEWPLEAGVWEVDFGGEEHSRQREYYV